MKENIRQASCYLANQGGENYRRTISQSTADGINHLSGGAIPDENSNVAHGVMLAGVGALALSAKDSRFIPFL